jgi:serine/threonine-protein kinase
MGRVYRGVHQTLGRVVAIKLLPSSFAQDSGYIQRFVREAQIAAQLNHPNLIGCYDFGESQWGYYFIMEFVEGISLADYLIEHHRMKVGEVIPILRQVCAGLGYAHAAGIIHRDIKPDDILWTRDGVVKVADLGLAKVEDKSDSGLTMLGMAIGTPNYISPEQVRGEADIDWRSDIYSLGATMFHCVTGRIPYDGNTPSMIMTRHVNDPVPIARQVNPDVSEAFSSLLVRMMQKDAHLRIANCGEVLKELDKIDPPAGAAEHRVPATEVLPAYVPVPDRMEKEGLFWIKFGAVILGVALLGGGYLVYKKRQEAVEPVAPAVQKPRPVAGKSTEGVKPASPSMEPSGEPPAAGKSKISGRKNRAKPPPAPETVTPAVTPVPTVAPETGPEKTVPSQPKIQIPPQVVGVRNPEFVRTADFVGTEAEPVTLNQKEKLTLTAQQNVYLSVNYASIVSQLENRLGHQPEYRQFRMKLFVLKSAPNEAALAVNVHQLTADPKQSFQYNRAVFKELSLKPTEQGYEIEFDVTDDYKRYKETGENYGMVLMTSQGGEAVFASPLIQDDRLWPALEIVFVPLQPPVEVPGR